MVSRVLASDGTFAKGFLDSRPTANFEQNFDRAGRGMLRTLLRVAGRANLDRRDACRLGGSENHIDDGDATMADPAARNCCRALIAGSPIRLLLSLTLYLLRSVIYFGRIQPMFSFFYFFISQVADSVPQRIL